MQSKIHQNHILHLSTYQVSGQVNKICVVLIDEFNHGTLQDLEVNREIITQSLQRHSATTLYHKLLNIKLWLQT